MSPCSLSAVCNIIIVCIFVCRKVDLLYAEMNGQIKI